MAVLDAPRLLTLDEVAERLRVSRRMVNRLVAAELLPVIPIGPRSRRVDPDALEEWLTDSTVGGSFSDSPAAESEMGRHSSTVDDPAGRRVPDSSPTARLPAGEGR